MRIFPSIPSCISLAAAVVFITVIAGAADEVQPGFVFDPDAGCPDRHDGILLQLFDAFGTENCVYNTISKSEREIICQYTDPSGLEANAEYEYHVSDDEYHKDWKPIYLFVSDTNKYAGTSTNSIIFDEPLTSDWEISNIENGGKCIENEGYLGGIRSKRRNLRDAPTTCEDTRGKFEINPKKGETRKTTCDKLWKKGWRKRKNKCKNDRNIKSNCPGVCERFDDDADNEACICKDNPFRFSDDTESCALLKGYDDDKQKKKCEKNSYKWNCPSVCNETCAQQR